MKRLVVALCLSFSFGVFYGCGEPNTSQPIAKSTPNQPRTNPGTAGGPKAAGPETRQPLTVTKSPRSEYTGSVQPPNSPSPGDRGTEIVSNSPDPGEGTDRDTRLPDPSPKNPPDPRTVKPSVTLPAFPGVTGNTGTDVGDLIPEISGKDAEGVKFNLSDYQGKVVMIDFWGHW